jgi:hypothetical protein
LPNYSRRFRILKNSENAVGRLVNYLSDSTNLRSTYKIVLGAIGDW